MPVHLGYWLEWKPLILKVVLLHRYQEAQRPHDLQLDPGVSVLRP